MVDKYNRLGRISLAKIDQCWFYKYIRRSVMAQIFNTQLMQCKQHPDCPTVAKIITWDCGCIEVMYISGGDTRHTIACDDLSIYARKIEHAHNQEPVLAEMCQKLQERNVCIETEVPKRQRFVYRGMRGGYRTTAMDDISYTLSPICVEDFVKSVRPRCARI